MQKREETIARAKCLGGWEGLVSHARGRVCPRRELGLCIRGNGGRQSAPRSQVVGERGSLLMVSLLSEIRKKVTAEREEAGKRLRVLRREAEMGKSQQEWESEGISERGKMAGTGAH